MKVAIAADHAGFDYLQTLLPLIQDAGYDIVNLGGRQRTPGDDYPDYAKLISEAIQAGQAERGILICGSGVGVSVAANKFKGVRAGICHDHYSAHQCVEHDDLNVLCIGQRIIGIEAAREIVFAFLAARFSGEDRHARRSAKITAFEQQNFRN